MNRKVSVAPMMDCTDKHERFFLRLISKNVFLYTEMIVSEAIDRGDKNKLLSFNLKEKPVALQLGGSTPKLLSSASKIGEEFGLTRERVRQIKEKAVRRLKQTSRSKILKTYLG